MRRAAQRHHYLFGQQNTLVAKAAADIRRHNANAAMLDPQAFRETAAHDVRLLGRGRNHQLVEAAIPVGEAAAPLDRGHRLAGGAQLARHRHVSGAAGRFHVAALVRGKEKIVAPRVVNECAAGLAGRQHVVDGGKLVDIEFDLLGQILGLGAGRRHTDRDALADVADLVPGQRPLIRGLEARERGDGADRLHAGEIIGGKDTGLQRFRDPHGLQAAVRDGAAHECRLQLAGELDVANELAAPSQITVVFLPQEARTNPLAACGKRVVAVSHAASSPPSGGCPASCGWLRPNCARSSPCPSARHRCASAPAYRPGEP